MWADAKNGDIITAYGNSKTRKNRVPKTQIVLTEGFFWNDPGDGVFVTRKGFSSGMSGGPVYNAQGQAVGIVLGTVTKNPGKDHGMYGLVVRGNGLFIPTHELEEAFGEMCKARKFMQPCDLTARPGGHEN